MSRAVVTIKGDILDWVTCLSEISKAEVLGLKNCEIINVAFFYEKTPHVDRLFDDICLELEIKFGVTKEEILSKRRYKHIVYAKYTIMYILRKRTFMTFKAIAEIFGVHHTSVIHGINLIDDLTSVYDEQFEPYADFITKYVNNKYVQS